MHPMRGKLIELILSELERQSPRQEVYVQRILDTNEFIIDGTVKLDELADAIIRELLVTAYAGED